MAPTEVAMVSFVILGTFTEQGIRNIKNMAALRQAAEQWTASQGGRVVANYTTLGQFDFVFIVELPSPEAVLEGTFLFGSQGEVRTETLLAFPADQAETIAQRIP
ncbi:MAG TPA: GYD domain-containing protein [Thermomicrobiales bacterium]|nr:GYD domain-containing protein [Thermomicrobiales bacterium]